MDHFLSVDFDYCSALLGSRVDSALHNEMAWAKNLQRMTELELEERQVRTRRLGLERLQVVVRKRQTLLARTAAELTTSPEDVEGVSEALLREDWRRWFAVEVLHHRRVFPRVYLDSLVRLAISLGTESGAGRIITFACEAHGPGAVHNVFRDAALEGALSESTYGFLLYYFRNRNYPGKDRVASESREEMIATIRAHPTPALGDMKNPLGRI